MVYWMMRHQALGGEGAGMSTTGVLFAADVDAKSESVMTLVGGLIGSIGYYIKKLFLPLPLNAFPAESPATPLLIVLGLCGIIAAALLVWWAWRRGDAIAVLLVGLFFATLSPSCIIAVAVISETPVAERYLYLPSIAACIGVAYAAGVLVEWIGAKAGRSASRAALVIAWYRRRDSIRVLWQGNHPAKRCLGGRPVILEGCGREVTEPGTSAPEPRTRLQPAVVRRSYGEAAV